VKLKIVQGGTKVLGRIRFWELTPKRDVKLNRAVKSWKSYYIFGNLRNDGALYGQSFDFMCAAVEEALGSDVQQEKQIARQQAAHALGKGAAETIPVVLGTIHVLLKVIFMPFKIIIWILALTSLIKK
jgi:hypothetical protein